LACSDFFSIFAASIHIWMQLKDAPRRGDKEPNSIDVSMSVNIASTVLLFQCDTTINSEHHQMVTNGR
jgi:hypothetical protein